MKKIIYTIMIAAAGLVCIGCDDLLDITPKDKMSPETFFENEAEIRAFAMNFYGAFPASSLYVANDDAYTQLDLSDELRGGAFRSIPASASDGGWNWGALRNINTLLDNLGNCHDQQVRIRYEALAKFFRAYFYFEKVKRFGDVPWYDTQVWSTETEKLNRPRDSREFIMGKMIEDIDFAIEHLPSVKSTYEVTKWTAMALKSRFLLFEGTFRKYHTEFDYGSGAHDWKWYLDLCAETSLSIMESSGYRLHTDGGPSAAYYNLFTTMNATDLSDEVILARDYNLTYKVYHNSNYTMNTGSMGRPGMTKKMALSFLMKDGKRFTDKVGWETMQFVDEAKDRDPRFAQAIRTPGYRRLGADSRSAPNLLATITGYHPTKYVTTVDQDTYNGSDIDLIIFRYGEILLNYAEAKAEAGSISQADLDKSVNLLRDRVGMPHLNMSVTADPFLTNPAWGGYRNVTGDKAAIILEIRRERSVELCQEGFRYYDIMRWKEGKVFEAPIYGMYFPGPGDYDLDGDGNKDILLYIGNAPESKAPLKYEINNEVFLSQGNSGYISLHQSTPRTWNENRDYLYPIPIDERSLTGGALKQNPGWEDGLSF